MKEEKEKRKSLKINEKQERGITLIALVITIIILLILASVTLNVVLGEGGLIDRAQEAKNLTEEAVREEQEALNTLMDEYANMMADDGNIKEPIDISIKESHTTESITIEVETNSEEEMTYRYYINGELKSTQNEPTYTAEITLENKEPYIPGGFTHTEGTVEEGYVIQDTSIGNEFVWIPVASGIYEVYVEAEGSNGSTGKSDKMTIEVSELTREINGETYPNWTEDEGNITDKKSVAYFKHSVVVNSGFYMGRYEMGMPGQESGDAPVLDFTNEARNISGVPVCVGQVMPWTNIDWSTAKANLESMYNGEVESAMMNSYARTTTLNWIYASGSTIKGIYQYGERLDENDSFKGNCYATGSADIKDEIIYVGYNRINSYLSIRHYSDMVGGNGSMQIDTGADTNPEKLTAANNIFDLAGNASEWTTERKTDGTGYRISGGCFTDSSDAHPAIDYNDMFAVSGTTGSISTSSRPILYK